MRFRLLAPLGAGLFATLALVARDAPGHDVLFDPSGSVAGGTSDSRGLGGYRARRHPACPVFGDETVSADTVPGRDRGRPARRRDRGRRRRPRCRSTGIALRPEQRVEHHARQARGRRRRPRARGRRCSTSSRAIRASSTPSRWRSTAPRSCRTIRSTRSKQWHLKRVGAETAWNYTCGQGVTVAVIDTGVACFDKGPFSRGHRSVRARAARAGGTSSTTTPRRPTTTATARTSPGPSRRRRTTAWGPRASRSARRSCPSRC